MNSGTKSTIMVHQNSHKLLMHQLNQRDDSGAAINPTLDDFRIQRNLGSGAYATVKLATHENTKKRVALKLYPLEKLDKVKIKAVQ